MKYIQAILVAAVVAIGVLPAAAQSDVDGFSPVIREKPFWGIQVENAEYRHGEVERLLAWDFDAFIGSDELKIVWRSEGEFELEEEAFETLENQLRAQVPISTFFDAVAGVSVQTPEGPTRAYGVVGVHGLAPQWFEIDADLFISDRPFVRFEAEYEGLITNRIILTPSIEIELPLRDDPELGVGAWGPKLEIGARLSYDLIDRAVAPYIGVHYEQVFGETANLARASGEDTGSVFFVAGVRLMY